MTNITFAGALNYTPTNFTGEREEVIDLFKSLWSKFKSWDHFHCYRRAQVLAHQFVHLDVMPVKVFYFRGNKDTLPRDWYYHVAPAVYHKDKLVIMDRGLFEYPSYGTDWINTLSQKSNCVEFDKYKDFLDKKKVVDCGYIVSSMYNFGPKSLDEDRTEFVRWELEDSLKSMTKRKRKKFRALYPID
jgi:hypothetical protein